MSEAESSWGGLISLHGCTTEHSFIAVAFKSGPNSARTRKVESRIFLELKLFRHEFYQKVWFFSFDIVSWVVRKDFHLCLCSYEEFQNSQRRRKHSAVLGLQTPREMRWSTGTALDYSDHFPASTDTVGIATKVWAKMQEDLHGGHQASHSHQRDARLIRVGTTTARTTHVRKFTIHKIFLRTLRVYNTWDFGRLK